MSDQIDKLFVIKSFHSNQTKVDAAHPNLKMVGRKPPILRILLVDEHNAADAAHPLVVSFLSPQVTVNSKTLQACGRA